MISFQTNLFLVLLSTSWAAKLVNWKVESSLNVSADPQHISSASYNDTSWMNAAVPSTSMNVLSKNGRIVSDPYYNASLSEVDGSLFDVPFWWRTCFQSSNSTVLRFRGINYRADIWLNGVMIADNRTIVGTFRDFDVPIPSSSALVTSTCVAVLIWRSHDVFWTRNATDLALDVVDWSVDPPDGNAGLWRAVDLEHLPGAVAVRHPSVTTSVGTATDLDSANVTVLAQLRNFGTTRSNGHVYITLGSFAQCGPIPVSVPGAPQAGIRPGAGPNAVAYGILDLAVGVNTCPSLRLEDRENTGAVLSQLWWPWQMHSMPTAGAGAVLHNLTVTFAADGTSSHADKAHTVHNDSNVLYPVDIGVENTSSSSMVGLREVTSELIQTETAGGQGRLFRVNGLKILVRGGGWAPDLLQHRSAVNNELQLRHVRNLGLNTIRFEGKFEDEDLYDRMDAMGLMGLPGLCCCDAWQNWKLWGAEQAAVANASMLSQMLRFRSHPSTLAFLLSSDELPPAHVEAAYVAQAQAAAWDVPTLPAASAVVSPLSGPSGVKMNGPYAWVPPVYWTDVRAFGPYGGAEGFSTEISPGASPMALESWTRTVPADELWGGNGEGATSSMWNFYCGNPHGLFRSLRYFLGPLEARYGPSSSARGFLLRAQAAAYESHRAMFEAYSALKYSNATGVVQWMLNNALPQHIWHLYDAYLNTGGAYFGAQRAMEQLHPAYDPVSGAVRVINSGYCSVGNASDPLFIVAMLVGPDGHSHWRQDTSLSQGTIDGDSVQHVLDISHTLVANVARDSGGVAFLRLELRQASVLGSPLAVNHYWLPEEEDAVDFDECNFYRCNCSSYANLTALQRLAPLGVGLQAHVTSTQCGSEPKNLRDTGVSMGKCRSDVILSNNDVGVLAFFVRLRLRAGTSSNAPSIPDPVAYWSDNYVTLLPGERRRLEVWHDVGDNVSIITEVWNDIMTEENEGNAANGD